MRMPIRLMITAAAVASVLIAQTSPTGSVPIQNVPPNPQTDGRRPRPPDQNPYRTAPIPDKVKTSTGESRPAATSGLAEFKLMVNSTNFKSYGFESVEEAASATLGEPAVAFLVRLDQLRKYKPTADARSLLSGGDKVFYPVMAAGQPRSSIQVDKGSGGWKAVRYGGAQLIQRLVQTRANVSGGKTMEVEVLALGAYFLGDLRDDVNLFLTPLVDRPDLNLKAGVAVPAGEVFARLVPKARAYNGLPR